MKTANEAFQTFGVAIECDAGRPSYEDFRAFNVYDIKAIQDEAFKAGLLKAIELCHANEMSHLYIWQRIQREHDKLT